MIDANNKINTIDRIDISDSINIIDFEIFLF